MILLVKLILAHLIGDFTLQPASWVKAKETHKLKSPLLYLHSLLHGLLAWLFVWSPGFWKWALLIVLLHFIIDACKLVFQQEKNKREFFFADQVLHLVSIFLVWVWYGGEISSFGFQVNEQVLVLLTAVVFLTQPVSIAVKVFISKWSPYTGDTNSGSQSAGKYIGILERLFVFSFVVGGHWEAIGFLIAAKSVFRFGDLKESKDRKLTEYILIGTLVSFGIAILTGVIYKSLPMAILP